MGHVQRDMPVHLVVPQLDVNSVIWKQDGASPHYYRDVTRCLNQTLSGRWISHGGLATQITRSDIQGLFTLVIHERLCVHTTHACGPSRAS
jgi:hypothetical protein